MTFNRNDNGEDSFSLSLLKFLALELVARSGTPQTAQRTHVKLDCGSDLNE